jgi:membrane-associated protease RseP (regulator of RpoE activity)
MRTTARYWSAVFAIALLLPVASRARADESSGTSWLGVYTQEITPELREGLSYNGQGVLVRRVIGDSPADRAGLQRGDVITRVGSRAVADPDELADVVRSTPAGKSVAVELVRDGQRKVVNVSLEEGPPSDSEGEEMAPTPPAEPDAPEQPESPRTPRPRRMQMRMNGQDFDFDLPNLDPNLLMVGRGRLGVRVESLNPDLASYFGPRDTKGALVIDVGNDTPAEKAGVRPGDVITQVGTHKVETASDLIEAIGSSEGKVSISLVRHGSREKVEATLGPMPRVMRLRGLGPEGFVWKEKPNSKERTREWSWRQRTGPDGSSDGPVIRKRISIDDGTSMDDMRKEMDQLRQELRELRRELESGKEK